MRIPVPRQTMPDEDIDKLDDIGVAREQIKHMKHFYFEAMADASDARGWTAIAHQQLIDVGRLLTKHNINWQEEVEWTDPGIAPPP